MLEQINHYLRMIKFAHTIFALPFAGIALVQALPGSGLLNHGLFYPALWLLIFQVLIAMVSLRSAAMGFNRIVDRKFDAENPRTAGREIPRGLVSLSRAILFVGVSLGIFILDAFWIGSLPGKLSPVAIALVLFYSYTKRFTLAAHFFLGAGIGLAPLATWIAVRNEFALLPALWSLGLMFYIAGFDILYSCQDADFDRSRGLHSIPSRLGIPTALWIARITHLVALGFFFRASLLSRGGPVLYLTLLLVSVLFAVEHALVRPGKLEHIPIAFFHINASISSILFLGLLGDSLLKGVFL